MRKSQFAAILLTSVLISNLWASEKCEYAFGDSFSIESLSEKAIEFTLTPEAIDLTKNQANKLPNIDPLTIDLTVFSKIVRGHFPGNPIVPGAISAELMVNTAAKALKQLYGTELELREIRNLVLLSPVRPHKRKQLGVEVNLLSYAPSLKTGYAEAVVEVTLKAGARNAATATFTLSNLPTTAIRKFKSPEQTPEMADKSVAKKLPQKMEMAFTEALTNTNVPIASVNPSNYKSLIGSKSQTSVNISDNPLINDKGHLPSALQIEVMAQSAIASLINNFKASRFSPLLMNVESFKLFAPLTHDGKYFVQTKVIEIDLASDKGQSEAYVIKFEASITQNRKIVSTSTFTGRIGIERSLEI